MAAAQRSWFRTLERQWRDEAGSFDGLVNTSEISNAPLICVPNTAPRTRAQFANPLVHG